MSLKHFLDTRYYFYQKSLKTYCSKGGGQQPPASPFAGFTLIIAKNLKVKFFSFCLEKNRFIKVSRLLEQCFPTAGTRVSTRTFHRDK